MSTTAIAAVAPRRRTTVRGEIVSVVSYGHPWVRTDAGRLRMDRIRLRLPGFGKLSLITARFPRNGNTR